MSCTEHMERDQIYNFRKLMKFEASKILPYKEKEFGDQTIYEDELDYPPMYTNERLLHWVCALPHIHLWNIGMCLFVLAALPAVVIFKDNNNYYIYFDLTYNFLYLFYVLGFAVNIRFRHARMTTYELFRFILDAISYLRILTRYKMAIFMLYLMRLNKPLEFLCYVESYEMRGSIFGALFKWTYLFFMFRVMWTIFFLVSAQARRLLHTFTGSNYYSVFDGLVRNITLSDFTAESYVVLKIFYPLGNAQMIAHVVDQTMCIVLVLMGSLMVRGLAVASLALVMALYLLPEQLYRDRYRLITSDLAFSRQRLNLSNKVRTFYRMYWEKYKAISDAEIMKILPPSLLKDLSYNVYFEALQKSLILRDLPNEVAAEISKIMTTVHFIPGNTIIKRNSHRNSMIFITYGDVELLTPEDDMSPILRMSRGSILGGCAGCCVVGSTRSQLTVRAATFCTAHVLRSTDFWRLLSKSKYQGVTAAISSAFYDKFENIKIHYQSRPHPKVKFLSNIYYFKVGLEILQDAKMPSGTLLLERDIFLEIAGCYRLRNNPDIHDPICQRAEFPCILQPSSTILNAWNLITTVCIILITIMHPYYLVFQDQDDMSFLYFDQVAFVIFVIDLLVHLSIGANIEEGYVINSGVTAIHRAHSRRTLVDVIAILPIFTFIGTGHFGGVNKLVKLPKIFQQLQILEDKCVHYRHAIRFIHYSCLVLVVTYLVAAVNQAVLCHGFGYCEVLNFLLWPNWAKAYPSNVNITTEWKEKRRLHYGLYWSIKLLTLTYHSQPYKETYVPGVLYTFVLIEFVALFHVFLEAAYAANIMVASKTREDFTSAIENITEYFIRNQIKQTVLKRFITYLELCWYMDEAYGITHKKQSIFHDLPPDVFQEIVAKQNMKYIMTIPFMKYLSKGELRFLASKLTIFYTSPNEILLNTGDVTNRMYILKQGVCQILNPTTKIVNGLVKSKGNFGVADCLLGVPVYYTIRAATHVEVYSLKKRHCTALFNNPRIKDAIDFCKNTQEYATLFQRQLTPFITFEPLPNPPNRCKFPLPKKHEKDAEFQYPFAQLGFFSMLRYVFPRFTILPDSQYLWRHECFRAACAVCSALLFPTYAYLSLQFRWVKYLRLFLDASAYFDIVQRLLVAYYNKDGVLVYHPASTAAHYIRNAFTLDLLACLPLETLEPLRLQSATEEFEYSGYVVLIEHQLLMNNRLLQLYRFFKTIDRLSWRQDLVHVFKYIIIYLAQCSILTSALVLYTAHIFYTTLKNKIHWQINGRSYADTPGIIHGHRWTDFYKDSYRFNLTESPWNLHVATFYWAVFETTTTGYNSVGPTNFNHLTALFVGMYINKMITTYFAVLVISCRATFNKALVNFQEQMKDLKKFMDNEKIDEHLQRKVTRYFEHTWDMTGGVDSHSVLGMCDQVALSTDTILQIYGPTFYECPVLTGCDASLLRTLSSTITDQYFLINTDIIFADEVIYTLYIINNGIVEIQRTIDGKTRRSTLRRGSIFGNLEKEPIRIPSKVVTASNVHLLEIKSHIFYAVIADFPDVLRKMKTMRPHNECYISTSVKNTEKLLRKQKWKTLYTLEFIDHLERKLLAKRPALLVYLIAVSLISIYSNMYHAGFEKVTHTALVTLYLADFFFLLKIPLMVIIPPNEEPKIKKKLKEIRYKYLKFELIIDVISLLPIETLAFIEKNINWGLYAKLRLNRICRIYTVYISLSHYKEKVSINRAAMTTISMLIWFSVVIHFYTCLWFFLGHVEELKEPESSWRYNVDGTLMCEDDYVCSLYHMVGTFTLNGLGGIVPRKHLEIVCVIFIQVTSRMIFMVIVGEFANIILYMNFRVFEYYSDCSQLKTHLKNCKVTPNLVNLVNKYMMFLWRETRGIQMPENVDTAPPAIRGLVTSAAFHRHIENHAVFRICEPSFLYQLVKSLRLYYYVEDMYLVRESEVTNSMYFVHSGCVEEVSKRTRFKRVYTAGQYFGSLQGLVRNQPFRFSYKTTTYSQILILNMEDWEKILKFYPRSKIAIYGKEPGEDEDYHYPDSGELLADSPPLSVSAAENITSNFSLSDSPKNSEYEIHPTTTRYNTIKSEKTQNVRMSEKSASEHSIPSKFELGPDENQEFQAQPWSDHESQPSVSGVRNTHHFQLQKKTTTTFNPPDTVGKLVPSDLLATSSLELVEPQQQAHVRPSNRVMTTFKSDSDSHQHSIKNPSITSITQVESRELLVKKSVSYHDTQEHADDGVPQRVNRQMFQMEHNEEHAKSNIPKKS